MRAGRELDALIARMTAHRTWEDLPHFTRSQLSLLDDDFARMYLAQTGKDLRK